MARGRNPLFEEFQLVTVKHHEGSTIFTYEGDSNRSLEDLQKPISGLIDLVQQEVEKQGGVVGHVKAFLEDEGASASLSATGGKVHIRQAKARNTRIHFAAIVFPMDEDIIREKLEQALSEL